MVGATFSSGAPISAVTFDGTGDYYEKTSITSTATSATKFVVALTYNTNTTADQTHMINMYSTSSSTYGFYIWINNGRSQLVVTQGTTGSEVYNVYTGTSTVTTGAWENIVWYFDMATFANCKCYKNGVSQSLTNASFNGTLSLNFNSIATVKIGQKNTAQTSTGNDYNGKLAQVYVNAVTVEPSINYFWDSSVSLPKDLGVYGTATGLPQPYVYHYGTTATFVDNRGTGFNQYTLTANGNVADTTGATYPTARTAISLTANGNAQISTAQSKFGGSSGLFDGTGDYISMSSIQYPGVDTFTIEGHFYITNNTTRNIIAIWHADIGLANNRHSVYLTGPNFSGAANRIYLSLGSGGSYSFPFVSYTVTLNTWFHLAISRDSSNNIRWFVNGTQQGSTQTDSKVFFPSSAATARIGSNSYEDGDMFGYFDEFRISSVARYTANFTAPTSPFVYDNSTLLLIHADNTNASTSFIDDAGVGTGRSRVTWTAQGNAQLDTAQFKFGSAALLLDGNGDYINTGVNANLNFGNTDHTIEGFIRLDSAVNNRNTIISNSVASFTTNWLKLGVDLSGGNYNLYFTSYDFSSGGTPVITSSVTLSLSTWYHFALVRSNTSWYMYIDGTQRGSRTDATGKGITANWNANSGTQIGRYSFDNGTNPASTYFDGWIDSIRISKTARYTANFTAPTAEFTNDANTVLLLKFDGADASQIFTDDNT